MYNHKTRFKSTHTLLNFNLTIVHIRYEILNSFKRKYIRKEHISITLKYISTIKPARNNKADLYVYKT